MTETRHIPNSVRSAATELLQFAFLVAVLTSIGLFLLDALFPDAVAPFLPLGTFLFATGILAILSAVFPHPSHHQIHKEKPMTARLRTAAGFVAVAVVAGVLLWTQMRDLGGSSVVLTGIAVGIVALLFFFLGVENEGADN
jgi:hypothetical protein